MATAVRRHSIVNPARRNRRVKARRRNAGKRRHMSAKQIRIFGTKRQKAALKRSHKRNRPAARRAKAHRAVHRKRAVRRRRNPGEILSLTLGNPARKRRKNKMAARKRNRRRSHASATRRHTRRRARRHNPVVRARRNRRVRHHRVTHRRRRNPGGVSLPNLFTDGLMVIGGLVGSRLLTQMMLGANNVGVWGYAANAAAGAALAAVAHMASKSPRVTNGIIVGTAAGIVARLFQDYTPFGSYLTQAGFGDYAGGGGHGVGLYLESNAVLPQRYVDAVNSAQVAIPAGWAPTTVVQSAGAGMGSAYDGYAGSSSSY